MLDNELYGNYKDDNKLYGTRNYLQFTKYFTTNKTRLFCFETKLYKRQTAI